MATQFSFMKLEYNNLRKSTLSLQLSYTPLYTRAYLLMYISIKILQEGSNAIQ